MMKTAKVLLLFGFIVGWTHTTYAQVKVGDNPLDIADERLLEMERADKLFIVTDSLELGITTNKNANTPATDAMMLKLYGYGIGQFPGPQSFFLGTSTTGEVVEFPLTLDLVTNSTTATLSLFNNINTFGDVDLTNLDSIFSTNNQLSDSLETIRTLLNDVSSAVDSDLDTIQVNELIDEISLTDNGTPQMEQSLLTFFEDRFVTDDNLRAISTIDLTFGMASDAELRDTAIALRDHIFYKIDGTLDEDRVVTGDGNSLTFTGINAFDVSGTSTSISADESVNISSANDNITLNASGDTVSAVGIVRFDEYPTITPTTMYSNILGIDADGNVVNVTAGDILGSEEDSVIYRHNGTLTDQRYMTMAGNNLHFVDGTDTTVIANDGRVAIGTGSFTPNSLTSNVKLEVNGDILAVRVHSSSDERFKKNITPIKSALDKVMSIKGVSYDFRTDEFSDRNFPTTEQVGFIAQNIEEVLPQVVRTNGDGYKAVDYAKVTALLTEAIKEQQLQIKVQAELITAQQHALSQLQDEMKAMSTKVTKEKERSIYSEEE